MSELDIHRGELQKKILDLDLRDDRDQGEDAAIEFIKRNWPEANRLITNWWSAYEDWEALDTFNLAVSEHRMTMRSFGSTFSDQVKKTIPMNIADQNRFFANSDRGTLSGAEQRRHRELFDAAVAPPKSSSPFGSKVGEKVAPLPYARPNRGIDTSAFANPDNFKSRADKYRLGLHDVSVCLLIPNNDVRAQSHHPEEKNPLFCFLPISSDKDQFVIYKLARYAKRIGTTIPDLSTLIRDYRSKMTRVKLANHYDVGSGLIAVPTPNRDDKLPYKVTYTVGNTLKIREEEKHKYSPDQLTKDGKAIYVNAEVLRSRQRAYFEQKASLLHTGNEFVIAQRRHKGQFPVYAVYQGDRLDVFEIAGAKQANLGTKTITTLGVANW